MTVEAVVARSCSSRKPMSSSRGASRCCFQELQTPADVCERPGGELRSKRQAPSIWRSSAISCQLAPSCPLQAPDSETHPRWHELHNQRRQRIDLVRQWLHRGECQLKFVVGHLADANEVLGYLTELGCAEKNQIWIMPEGTTTAILDERAEWLVPWCLEHGFHFCQRKHIYWYGNRRGT